MYNNKFRIPSRNNLEIKIYIPLEQSGQITVTTIPLQELRGQLKPDISL